MEASMGTVETIGIKSFADCGERSDQIMFRYSEPLDWIPAAPSYVAHVVEDEEPATDEEISDIRQAYFERANQLKVMPIEMIRDLKSTMQRQTVPKHPAYPRGVDPKSAEGLRMLQEHRLRHPQTHPRFRHLNQSRNPLIDACWDLNAEAGLNWRVEQTGPRIVRLILGPLAKPTATILLTMDEAWANSREDWREIIKALLEGRIIPPLEGRHLADKVEHES
jgi:hypothetical protein